MSRCRSRTSFPATSASPRPGRKLGRVGTGRWEKTRAAAERATLDLAAQLLEVQARRAAQPGHAFPPDTAWQREFESSFPFHRDARPAPRHRRDQGRHGAGAPDGPPRLRRCRLWQDRGGHPGRVQGRHGRPAGGGARAHHRPRPTAPQHLPRTDGRLPVRHRDAQPVPHARGSSAGSSPRRPRAQSTS